MAVAYNRGALRAWQGIDLTAVRLIFLTTGYTHDPDDNVVDDVDPTNNASATERLSIATITPAQDDTNDRANLNSSSPAGVLTATGNGDAAQIAAYEFVTGDGDSHLLWLFRASDGVIRR